MSMIKSPRKNFLTGFTLIEIMVAVSIFATVAVIAIGAVLSANDINKKAQAIKTVMDNLNFALDSMTLKLKQGGGYYCAASDDFDDSPSYLTDADSRDCASGGTAIAFKLATGETPLPQFIYRFNGDTGKLQVSTGNEGSSMSPFTDVVASEINIESGLFYVAGNCNISTPECDPTSSQPRVIISMHGKATIGQQSSDFAIQTTVSDRR